MEISEMELAMFRKELVEMKVLFKEIHTELVGSKFSPEGGLSKRVLRLEKLYEVLAKSDIRQNVILGIFIFVSGAAFTAILAIIFKT
jgi:hypothetical protein